MERLVCCEEGLLVERAPEPDPFLPIAVCSFLGPSADVVDATPENTLLLLDEFRQRYLQDGREWQQDIRPRVETFLRAAVKRSDKLRLILDAHASIAFLAGSVLDLKSSVDTQLVQKGRVGRSVWRADDPLDPNAARFSIEEEVVGEGDEIAVAISVARAATSDARAYVAARLPRVGRLITYALSQGVGQSVVAGGGHAAVLAEQVSNHLREVKHRSPATMVHIFAAAPNSLLFFLGQEHQAIAPCIVYEFDFDSRSHKTYQPSFVIG